MIWTLWRKVLLRWESNPVFQSRGRNTDRAVPSPHPVGNECNFPGGKAAEAWRWLLTLIYYYKNAFEMYVNSAEGLQGAILK
jgi:hypothetical protein